MKIFFVGYMASGKSTLGKRVARELAIPFIDMDKAIEEAIGMSIPEIFEQLGEKSFRQAETKFLNDLSKDQSPVLIATGGGAPCFNKNMEVMNELGLTLYLNRPIKELANRISNSKKSRPLTDNLSNEELINFISKHLKEREEHYRKSELVIERSDQTTKGILEALQPYSSEFLNNKKR